MLQHVTPVSIFVGLILLAILLLVSGVVLLLGFENVRGRFIRSGETQDGSKPTGKALADVSHATGNTPRSALRPYRVAKSQGQSHNDQMIGLLLVLAGLGMLYVVPAMLYSSWREEEPRPPRWQEDPASRRDRVSSSQAGQGLLGALTLVVLIVSFAMLKPEKQTQKSRTELSGQL